MLNCFIARGRAQRNFALTQPLLFLRADGVRNVIRLLGQSSEKIRKLKAEDLVDDRFVKKLEREGRF